MSEAVERPPWPGFHHVTLKTTRKEEMIAWYRLVVGLEPNWNGAEGAWLSNDRANHRMALLVAPAVRDDPDKLVHAGLHHTAYEFGSLGGLLENYARLREHGIEPHITLDHGMTISLYYLDPDGNSVELQVDNFLDWDKSSNWMRTSPEFNANPIGTPCDPAAMLEAHRAGMNHEELHRAAYAGEYPPTVPPDPRLPV
jgi:catechol-2,3-dioxygenase